MSKKNRSNGQGNPHRPNASHKNQKSNDRVPQRRQNTGVGASNKSRNDGTNREYKDRLFKALFGSPDRKELTLELYNALNESSYTNPEEIELTTIGNVVFMGMRNDVSFLFDQVMNL